MPRTGARIGAGVALAAAVLAGCAGTLPAPEATAFRTLASADRDAFAGVTDREAAAGLGQVQRLLDHNEGSVVISNCTTRAGEDCTVTYTVGGARYDLVQSSPNTRALLGSIVRYADAMADLCEAKDLEGVKAKAEGAAGAVKALAAVVPGAGQIVGAIVDAATFAGNAGLRAKRRRALLTVALAARGPIAAAAPAIEAQSAALRGSTLRATSEALLMAQGSVTDGQRAERALLRGRQPEDRGVTEAVRRGVAAIRTQRQADLAQVVALSRDLNAVRRIRPGFDRLVTAHDKLIAKLQDPKVSLEDAMADVDAVLTLLDTIAGAKKSGASS